jgi:hypothetical protein
MMDQRRSIHAIALLAYADGLHDTGPGHTETYTYVARAQAWSIPMGSPSRL